MFKGRLKDKLKETSKCLKVENSKVIDRGMDDER